MQNICKEGDVFFFGHLLKYETKLGSITKIEMCSYYFLNDDVLLCGFSNKESSS